MKSLLVAVVTAIVTSMGWLVAFNTGVVTPAGETVADVPAAPAEPQPRPMQDVEFETVGEEGLDRADTLRLDPELRRARSVEIGPRGMAVPVAGVAPEALVDTYTQARAGGARRHDAIDIMADTGTPVVAAAPGVLEKIYFSDGGGGKTLYVRSHDKKWIYYYAHLEDYAPGLVERQRIALGQRLGTVGSSGNAAADAPHLHFAIHRMEPEEGWWEGRPVNPYPLLAGEEEDR
ncbi:M23 family metallopeptidase [Sphingomicrobium astaxanthinifaciens]|uniref:M23 family metallopeptidase n=1 Tax=Sphingomicrobium astaxanthinifaciens TaxID=1227949 RepID=UPI001FCB0668|nr:M23 family metallopeptidase [Sphingomicrobium astaxanthinifaciens]MCJ7422143.1 M23 family metallopeptidase [Sphingomicrobium astaxanthinifaciens]